MPQIPSLTVAERNVLVRMQENDEYRPPVKILRALEKKELIYD